MYCIIGIIKRIDLIFQGHLIIKTVKISLVCTLSPESIGGLGDIVFLRKHSFHFS